MDRNEIVERGMNAPLYAGALEGATHTGEAVNAGCKDRVRLDFKISDGRILAARHTCKACVLTTAMADVICEAMEGQTPDFVFTLEPLKMLGIPIAPHRRECIIVVMEALGVSLHL